MTSRNYVFTLNNYDEAELAFFQTCGDVCPKIKYCIFGCETAESGTPHLQGYMVLNNSLSKRAVHKLAVECRRLHLEVRLGSAKQARDYCMKGEQSHDEWSKHGTSGANYGLNSRCFESGDKRACGQGKRTDLDKAKDALRAGMHFQEFLEEYSGVASRCMRFFEKYYQGVQKMHAKEFRDVDVTVLYGAPGSGKTRAVFEMYPSAFNVDCSVAFPFDGYDGEDVIVLNDFKGNLQRKTFLETLEGYPQKVNVKNGHTWARWTKVFITSNYAPWDWYREYTWAEGRRLNAVIKFEAPEIKDDEPETQEEISDTEIAQFIETLEQVPQELESTIELVKVAEGNSETSATPLKKTARVRAMEKIIEKLCGGVWATVKIMPKITLKHVAEPTKYPGMRCNAKAAWSALPREFTG